MERKPHALTIVAIVAVLAAGVAGVFVAWPRREVRPPPELVPSSWAEFRTSQGHALHVGQRNIECGECHDYRKAGFATVELARCGACHETEAKQTHHGGAAKKTDCLTCHSFSPKSPPACKSCHTGERTPESAALVSVHATVGCDECHHVHNRPALTDAECLRCHKDVKLSHTGQLSSGCRDCHRAHEPAKNAPETCATCHRSPKGPKPAGHDSCLTCHAPHDFRNAGSKVCAGCHTKQATLVSAVTVEHRACTNCHQHHEPRTAASSCKGCHAGVHVEHARENDCIRCHEPHGGQADVAIATCTSCHHEVAASDKRAHAGATPCTACHKAHGFSGVDRQALCVSCHAREIELVATNHAHENCANCHGTSIHQPKPSAPCGACHARERATAPPGHQACASCHDAHGASVPPIASCASCHKMESASKHGGISGGCASCHRPHGDSHDPAKSLTPPPCVSCHAPKTLPGLHAVAQHTACNKCHEAHGQPRDDRATCTSSCHTDQRTHEKTATACAGCHVFAG